MGPTTKPFSYYLGKEVHEIDNNPELAKALRHDAQERIKAAHELTNPKYVLETLYEAIRCELDARLAEQGFRSYSHKATLAFAKEKLKKEFAYIDRLRELRHKSRYYGKNISIIDVNIAKARVPEIIKKLQNN